MGYIYIYFMMNGRSIRHSVGYIYFMINNRGIKDVISLVKGYGTYLFRFTLSIIIMSKV